MRRKPGRPGLSLLEVLVTMAIVAVLLALLWPVFHSARRAAVRTDCRSHLQQIGTAYQLYVSDWGAYPRPWALTHSPSLSGSRLLFCPDDQTERPRGAASSYIYTAAVPPDFARIDTVAEVHPGVVLVRCEHHLQQRITVGKNDTLHRSRPLHPYYMVLRAGGAVQEISVDRKRPVQVGRGPWLVDLFPGEPGYEKTPE